MSSRRAGTSMAAEAIALRSLEILEQMTSQVIAGGQWRPEDADRLARIRHDLAKLVHWALHDHGDPDIITRIRDCYRRCAVDIDDSAVLRKVRGVVKGQLRKAGIDTTVPGLDPALDAATIILTTRRTIQRMGGASSGSLTAPGPALDRKPSAPPPAPAGAPKRTAAASSATSAPPAAPPAEPAVKEAPTHAAGPAVATTTMMKDAFDRLIDQSLNRIRGAGRQIERPDYLAAVFNDPPKKAKLLDQIAEALPPVDRAKLAQAVDGFFRSAFKGSYIERTDSQGHRRAHKR